MPPVSLCDLAPGECATVAALHTTGPMRRRLLDLGLVEHTPLACVGESPAGDMRAYLIRGAVIALRRADGETILVEREAACPWD